MRKMVGFALALLLSALPFCASAEAGWSKDTHTAVAIAYWIPDAAGELGLPDAQTKRIVYMEVMPLCRLVPVLLPEGMEASGEALDRKGVLLTFATALPLVREGNRVAPDVPQAYDTPLAPVAVDFVGTMTYGLIQSLTKTSISLQVFPDLLKAGEEPLVRYTITDDTQFCYPNDTWADDLFLPGTGCQVVVDAAGNVLAAMASNG